MKKNATLFAILAIISAYSVPAQAANGTWTDTTTGGLWSTTGNWSGGTVADGSGSTADFSQIAMPSALTVKMDAPHTLTNLIFGTTSTTVTNTLTLTNNGNAANILTLAGTTPTITVTNPATSGSTVANLSLEVDGTAGLTKAGNGTLILSATNNYSGGTTISAGTLQIGSSGGLTGNLGTGNVTDNGTLVFARADVGGYTVSNNISGTGAVTKSGNGGLLILTGANSYTGATNINNGILNIQNNTALGGTTTAATVAAGATLQLQGGITVGAKALNLAGTGAITSGATATGALENVSGANTYGGLIKLTADTTISSDAGSLALTNTGTLFGSTTGLNLTLTGAGNGSLASIINGGVSNAVGAGGVTKSGSGTWTLSASNTYTGATQVNGGTLVVTGGLSTGSTVTVGNGTATAILAGSGTINGAVSLVSSGGFVAHLAPGTTPGTAGTLHVGGLGLNIGNGSALDIDLSSTVGGSNDLISMSGGTLTFGGTTTINFNELDGSLATGSVYTLITGATGITGFNASSFVSTGLNGFTATYTIVGNALDVTFSSASVAAAYFNGLGNDLNTAGNYDAAATGNSVNTTAPTGTTNVFFSANRNASTTPNISAPLAVNSVNFGAGTGTNTGMTISSSNAADTLTINASNANGNTAGSGITTASNTSNTISAPVILGASQLWTTAANSTLTVSGQVSGTAALTKAGAGTAFLSSATGNTYTGGTTVTAGKLFVNNTSNSGTGTGSVTVQSSGTLAGSGTIKPAGGAGVTILSGGTLASGGVQVSDATHDTVTGTGMTIDNTEASTAALTINGGATLSFALGAGSSTGALNFANPNKNSTYLSLTGTTVDQIFANTSIADTINVVDLTAFTTTGQPSDTLQLRTQNPYLLIATGLGTDADFANILTTGGLGQNGYVLGVSDGSGGYVGFNLTATDINGDALSAPYNNLRLYLNDGNLEMVPEPGTWALMLGGLTMLVFWQRRKSKLS